MGAKPAVTTTANDRTKRMNAKPVTEEIRRIDINLAAMNASNDALGYQEGTDRKFLIHFS